MKPIVQNAVLIASFWPVVLLSSLVVDSFPLAPRHPSTAAQSIREHVAAMASNDLAVDSSRIASSTGSPSTTNLDALGTRTQALASRRLSCVAL
jgi:hypothetical protein